MATSDHSDSEYSLPDASSEALESASLLDEEFHIETLLALDISPAALDPLFDRKILHEVEDCRGAIATFTSSEQRAEISEAISWSRRRALHDRIARVLRDRRAPFDEIARHFQKAHNYCEARKSFVRAAEVACQDNRYPEAFAALREALSLWPASEAPGERHRILREMARCARNCGELDQARLAWKEVLEAVTPASGPESDLPSTLEAHRQLADLESLAGNHLAARDHLYAAAKICDTTCSDLESAQQWFAVSFFLTDRIRLRDALDTVRRARKKAEQAEAHALLSECLGWEGLVLAMMGRAEEAHAFVDDSLQLALNHELTEQVAIAYRRLANIRDYGADYQGERDAHLHAIQLCRDQEQRSGEQSCLSCLSYAFVRTGEWKRALETAKNVLEDNEAHPALKTTALTVNTLIAVFRGETRRAEALLEQTLLATRQQGIVGMEFFALWADAVLARFGNDHDRAARSYRELKQLWHETEDRHDAVPGIVSAAAFFADRSQSREVGECCDILNAIHQENDNDETRSARLAVLAEQNWVSGKLPAAIQAMSEACEGYARLGTPLEEALARRRLARLHAAAGDWENAETASALAATIARRLGLRPLLDALEQDRAKANPSQAAASSQAGNTSLTTRQRDVLRLIATGLTNKEAAARLNLSPRTVEMHVARILERLNCRSRTEAIRRATETGLLK